MNGQSLVKAFIPLPGQATAVYTSTGLDHYQHSDWLGSVRLTSSPSQTYTGSIAYAPFGETYASYGSPDTSFTGMKPDTVSTAYDFLMREYSTEGRWPSPDPAGLAAVNPANPQSWNRYAYVHNNPLNYVDPYGLCSASFDYTYDLYGYVINGVFYIVGGWIEISNLELFDCGPQQRRGPGAGPGGGQVPKPTPRPTRPQQFNACVAQAAARENQALVGAIVETTGGGAGILVTVAVGGPLLGLSGELLGGESLGAALEGLEAGSRSVFTLGLKSLIFGGLYVKGIADITAALNQYDRDVASCQVHYGFPNVP